MVAFRPCSLDGLNALAKTPEKSNEKCLRKTEDLLSPIALFAFQSVFAIVSITLYTAKLYKFDIFPNQDFSVTLIGERQQLAIIICLELIPLFVGWWAYSECTHRANQLFMMEKMHATSAKALRESEAEAAKFRRKAFKTINHAAKRTMLNSCVWAEQIKNAIPKIQSNETGSEIATLTEAILKENMEGAEMCRDVILTFSLPLPPVVTMKQELPTGMIAVACDDDRAGRTSLKGILKQRSLNLNLDKSLICGETFEEAESLVEKVLSMAHEYGDERILCIFDQNLDMYVLRNRDKASAGKIREIYGTDITKSLRSQGFRGAIFIRSANDDCESANTYANAGATGSLSKGWSATETAAEVTRKWRALPQ